MLKLEKSRKNSEITIRLRKPQRFLDRYFLFALAAAIGIHLLAALVFHVRLFSFGQIETLLPPTRTIAHFIKGSTDDSDAIVIAQVNMQGRLTPAQLAPVLSSPTLQPLPPPKTLKPLKSHKDHGQHPFIFLENQRAPEDSLAHLDIPLFIPTIQILPVGLPEKFELLKINAKEQEALSIKKINPKKLQQTKLVYAVQIESSTGHVFWYQLEGPSRNKSQADVAEHFLKHLFFQPTVGEFVLNGHVEFIFSGET